jgi:hypothetical protein
VFTPVVGAGTGTTNCHDDRSKADRRQWLLSEAQQSVSQADSGLPDVLSVASSKAPVGYRLSPTCFPCAAT